MSTERVAFHWTGELTRVRIKERRRTYVLAVFIGELKL